MLGFDGLCKLRWTLTGGFLVIVCWSWFTMLVSRAEFDVDFRVFSGGFSPFSLLCFSLSILSLEPSLAPIIDEFILTPITFLGVLAHNFLNALRELEKREFVL